MKTLNKFLVSIALLCMSQTAFAACDDEDAYDDCIETTGDENNSIGSGTGGGGSLGFGGSGSGSGSGGGTGVGTGDSGSGGSTGEEEAEEEEVDPKLELEKCKQDSKRKLGVCNAKASSEQGAYMREYCDPLLYIVAGAGGSSVSDNSYTKCRNRSLDNKENKEDVCTVFHENRVYACY